MVAVIPGARRKQAKTAARSSEIERLAASQNSRTVRAWRVSQQAKARGVELMLQPEGMSLRQRNSTSYNKKQDVRLVATHMPASRGAACL